MEALNLSLGLRMLYPPVDREDVQAHQPFLKLCVAVAKTGKLGAVVREDSVWQAIGMESILEGRDYDICSAVRSGDLYGEATVIVQNVQRIAVLAVLCQKLALEIRLPHLVTSIFLIAKIRFPLLRFFLLDAAVTVQDGIHRSSARHASEPLVFQNLLDRFGTPSGILCSHPEDLRLYLGWCLVRNMVWLSAAIQQFFAGLIALQPLIPCPPRYPVFPAHRAEIAAVCCGFGKAFSLFFHSSALPRHLYQLPAF